MDLYSLEQIPGSTDRTGRGVIGYHWWRRNQALKPFSEIASRMGACELALERHKRHCDAHPNDRMAEERRDQLTLLRAMIAPRFSEVRDKFARADEEYRHKMFELADVPASYLKGFNFTTYEDGRITRSYNPKAEVRIISSDGTVMILFGEIMTDGARAGCWILYANGAPHHERTPADIDRIARISF